MLIGYRPRTIEYKEAALIAPRFQCALFISVDQLVSRFFHLNRPICSSMLCKNTEINRMHVSSVVGVKQSRIFL